MTHCPCGVFLKFPADLWLRRLQIAWLSLEEAYSHPGPYSLGQLVWSIDWLIELEYLKEENNAAARTSES